MLSILCSVGQWDAYRRRVPFSRNAHLAIGRAAPKKSLSQMRARRYGKSERMSVHDRRKLPLKAFSKKNDQRSRVHRARLLINRSKGIRRLIPLTQVRLYVVGATRGRSVLLRGLSRLMMSQ